MRDFRLTLRNYRCFRDDAPVMIELRKGFTALVGPNNSGKSTILKFIHELKSLWAKFVPESGDIATALRGDNIGVDYRDIGDSEELFCNANRRGLSFRIELLELESESPGRRFITGLCGIADRSNPQNWKITFLHGPKYKKVETGENKRQNPDYISDPERTLLVWNQQQYDFSAVIDLLSQLNKCLYIPPFRNAINEGSGTYYGLAVGSSFVELWDSWKSGGSISQARSMEEVTEDLKAIFSYEKLEINASRDGKEIRVTIDRLPYRLAELGSGLSQFIIIFGNAAIREIPLILIDEPEINLHPSLQAVFLSSLARYADGNIIFATHSVGLARATAECIYSFRLGSDRVPIVTTFEQTANYAEFAGEMSFSAFKELGFDSILLVEGVTDVKTYQQFLRKLRNDASVVVIPLGGDAMVCGGREHELDEIKRITSKVFAIVDSERTGKGKRPAKNREAFKLSCEALDIAVQLTERRATENYFTDEAVKAVLGEKASALGEFDSLKGSFNGWRKSQHNWQIASQMTKEDIENTDIGRFLSSVFESDE